MFLIRPGNLPFATPYRRLRNSVNSRKHGLQELR
jgi:hypothetical protein